MIRKENILVEVSNRHVHLSRKDLDTLFSKDHQLKVVRWLSQPGQFVAKEKVNLINGNKIIENVKVLGPERKETQIELLKGDAFDLGINAFVRSSGDLEGTPGIKMVALKGVLDLPKGVIVAQKHLHASEKEAEILGINNGDIVNIKILRIRDFVFNNIIVRAGPTHRLAFHIDKDEGKECNIIKKDIGVLL